MTEKGFDFVIEMLTSMLYNAYEYSEHAVQVIARTLEGKNIDPSTAVMIASVSILAISFMVIKRVFKYVAAGIAIGMLVLTLSKTNIVSGFIAEVQTSDEGARIEGVLSKP